MSILRTNRVENGNGAPLITSEGRHCVKFTRFQSASESSLSDAANAVYWNAGNVVKEYGSSTSTLFVKAVINGCDSYSGNCGTYLEIGGVRNYDFNYQYNNWSDSGTVTIEAVGEWTTLGAGSHAITAGWSTNDGSTGNRPFVYFNGGNGRADSRRNQQESVIHIWEVLL